MAAEKAKTQSRKKFWVDLAMATAAEVEGAELAARRRVSAAEIQAAAGAAAAAVGEGALQRRLPTLRRMEPTIC